MLINIEMFEFTVEINIAELLMLVFVVYKFACFDIKFETHRPEPRGSG